MSNEYEDIEPIILACDAGQYDEQMAELKLKRNMKKEKISISISKEADDKAIKKAEKEGRSKSNWIERLILKSK